MARRGVYECAGCESDVFGGGDGEQLLFAVMIDESGDVEVVAWSGTSAEGEDFVGGEVFGMQNGADIEGDPTM
jgi:hypothetical protein